VEKAPTTTTTTTNTSNNNNKENKLAPFNPTCTHAQTIALNLLSLQTSDVLFDLGCGDGRFLCKAIQHIPYGLSCVGVEYDEMFVTRAKDAVANLNQELTTKEEEDGGGEGGTKRSVIEIRHGDVLNESIISPSSTSSLSLYRDGTAIFLYLLPKGLKRVKPLLEKAALERKRQQQEKKNDDDENDKPLLRIVSYMFSIPGWDPIHVDRSTKGECPVYLYHLT